LGGFLQGFGLGGFLQGFGGFLQGFGGFLHGMGGIAVCAFICSEIIVARSP
jgi:hypothetical protein